MRWKPIDCAKAEIGCTRHCRFHYFCGAIENWRAVWRTATFVTDTDFAQAFREGKQSADEVLEDFGSVPMMKHGRKVWKTQANALAKAPLIEKGITDASGSG